MRLEAPEEIPVVAPQSGRGHQDRWKSFRRRPPPDRALRARAPVVVGRRGESCLMTRRLADAERKPRVGGIHLELRPHAVEQRRTIDTLEPRTERRGPEASGWQLAEDLLSHRREMRE